MEALCRTQRKLCRGRLRRKKGLWREAGRKQLETFLLAPWASRRRHDLLEMVDRLSPMIAELTQGVEQEAAKYPVAQRLATHPGVGSLSALAFVLIIGQAERFHCGNQVASYVGLVPAEDSSGERQRLGHISKQRQHSVVLSAGGSSPGNCPQRCRVASEVFPSGAAAWKENRQSGDGTATGGSSLLDVAS